MRLPWRQAKRAEAGVEPTLIAYYKSGDTVTECGTVEWLAALARIFAADPAIDRVEVRSGDVVATWRGNDDATWRLLT